MSRAKIPEYLYKYCSAERGIQILSDDYIYLTPLNKLNDIYEFTFQGLLTEKADTRRKLLVKTILAHSEGLININQAEKMAENASIEDLDEHFEGWISNFREQMSRIREHSGLTCFSELMNNQRMWGTYGDNHYGLCIEFRTKELHFPSQEYLLPVMYTRKNLNLCFSELLNEDASVRFEYLHYLAAIKHSDWKEESEWRILYISNEFQDMEARKFMLVKNEISRIFLGPLTPSKMKKKYVILSWEKVKKLGFLEEK